MYKNHYLYNYALINKAEQASYKTKSSFIIMKKAAKACSNYIKENIKDQRIIVICGPGNNGGDGILIANNLIKKNYNVDVCYPLGEAKTTDSKKALKLLSKKHNIIHKVNFKKYNVIIDAIFGSGLNRNITKKIILLFKKINKSKAKIFSIDMPSGVFTDNGKIHKVAIKANYTLSIHRFKIGQWLLPGKDYCGQNILLKIGLKNLDKKCFVKLNFPIKPPKPSLYDHKYSRGCCLIIGGDQFIGASKLAYFSASQSSLRAGAGVCKFLIKEKNIKYFKSHVLEEMILSYKNLEEFFSLIKKEKNNSVIYGCGLNNTIENKEILDFLLKQNSSLVLDAGAFSIIEKYKNFFFKSLYHRSKPTVMTPHLGEFKKLFKISNNKINDSLLASKETNSIIVFKGDDTVISSPNGKVFINSKSSPFLATAGSGDVLAGLIGGFLSQKIDSLEAIKLACYIHSQCAINLDHNLIARDIINEVPHVIKKMMK